MIEILSAKRASFMLYSARSEIFDAIKIVIIIKTKEQNDSEILAVILVKIPLTEINIMLIKIKIRLNELLFKNGNIA